MVGKWNIIAGSHGCLMDPASTFTMRITILKYRLSVRYSVGYSFELVIMKGSLRALASRFLFSAITCGQSANFNALWAVLVALYSVPRSSLGTALNKGLLNTRYIVR